MKDRKHIVKHMITQHKGTFILAVLGGGFFILYLVLLFARGEWGFLPTGLAIASQVFTLLALALYCADDARMYAILKSRPDWFWKGTPAPDHPLLKMIREYVMDRAKAEVAEEYSELINNKQMEIEVLQGRINPHFLYNTLDSIRGEALLQGAVEVANMAEALAFLFRYSINVKGNFVPLADELQNVNHYMALQKFRFEDRFSYQLIVENPDVLQCIIPKLTLQPLVENAISHGLESMKRDGLITIRIQKTDCNLIINVIDNGAGIEAKKLAYLQTALHSGIQSRYDAYAKGNGTGIALHNVNDRIKISFGAQYGLSIYSVLEAGTNVEITLPIFYEMPEK